VTVGRDRTAAHLPRLALATAALAALLVVAAPARPAAADPPRPTNYRSEVESIRPALPKGVELAVVGGDAFLELRVGEGRTAEVVDYGEDPTDPDAVGYLRFGADGVVERNRAANATAVNDDRFSSVAPGTPGDDEWEVVARDGTYAWHDHRIHWMSSRPPQVVADDGTVDLGGPEGRWEIVLLVDGEPTTVRGRLVLLDPPSPLPWAALGLGVAAAGVVVAGRQRRLPAALLAAVAVVGALAALASWLERRAAPAGSGATIVGIAIAATAVVAALLALAGPARIRLGATAAAAAALVGWGLTRTDALVRAVLPTPTPALDRLATALALGAGVALAVALVRWPPARPPRRAPAPAGA
jgi:hypothetical protein